jgi:hypothetical protein
LRDFSSEGDILYVRVDSVTPAVIALAHSLGEAMLVVAYVTSKFTFDLLIQFSPRPGSFVTEQSHSVSEI